MFSKYIRLRDKGYCCTCNRFAGGSGYHAGHWIPDSVGGVALRYHENNVHGQCYNCNINRGGWGEQYTLFMELKYGREKIDELRAMKYQTSKWSEQDYQEKIDYYTNKLHELQNHPER